MKNQKTLYLIDGMSVVFRAYHAMSKSELTTPDGMPSGAVFAFINIITRLLDKHQPEHIACVFDRSEPTFRHKMYPEYKANRDEFPQELVPQLSVIKNFLDLIGMPRIEKPGFEADDIIGTLAKQASSDNYKVVCLTNDKDYYQLVNENTLLYKPQKGDEFDIVDIQAVKDKFGVAPIQVIDVLALMGDASDNVPGVKGVGEKTAIPMVQEFGSVEGIYDNIEKITRKAVKTKLETDKDKAFLSKTLVTIDTDVELDITHPEISFNNPNYNKLDDLFKDMGFRTLREKWLAKAGGDYSQANTIEEVVQSEQKTIDNTPHNYKLISTIAELELIVAHIEEGSLLSFDLETDALDRLSCSIVGIALSWKEGTACYVSVSGVAPDAISKTAVMEASLFDEPTEEFPFEDSCIPVQSALDILKPILENMNIPKCGQNAKFDMYILKRYGINVAGLKIDSMLASYLLDPSQKHNMDALAQKWLHYTPVSIKSLIGEKKKDQKSMRDLPPQQVSDYACEDADITLQLCNLLASKLKEQNLEKLAYEIEFPLSEVLTYMEFEGASIDKNALKDLEIEMKGTLGKLTKDIYSEAGLEFNIDSPKQLAHVLFEKLMIPPVKKTKTGFSTDVEVMNQLAETYPIASMILEYRSLAKLLSTYIEALPKLVNPNTGRIHTTYNQTVAATGRLSSTDPNLQNIPIRSDNGKEIRKAFIPKDKNHVLLAADYSQVELRIMAYICEDKKMVDGFKHGLDVHTATAAILNNISHEEVTKDMRRIAKTVNFGIMYGLGSFGLSQRIGISRKESKEIIEDYFEKYPGIKKYMDITVEETQKLGYAQTLCGRRRYFPEINDKNRMRRTAAERGAINMPIQGTASDMMKIAMIKIHNDIQKHGLQSKMILQVHDELIFEAHKDELEQLKDLVITNMVSALSLGDVPVVVDSGIGNNWFEAH